MAKVKDVGLTKWLDKEDKRRKKEIERAEKERAKQVSYSKPVKRKTTKKTKKKYAPFQLSLPKHKKQTKTLSRKSRIRLI